MIEKIQTYSTRQVATATGVSEHEIKTFIQRDFISQPVEGGTPGRPRRWSFEAAIELALLHELRRSGVPLIEARMLLYAHWPNLRKNSFWGLSYDKYTGRYKINPNIDGGRLVESVVLDEQEAGSGWVGDPESETPARVHALTIIPVWLIIAFVKIALKDKTNE